MAKEGIAHAETNGVIFMMKTSTMRTIIDSTIMGLPCTIQKMTMIAIMKVVGMIEIFNT